MIFGGLVGAILWNLLSWLAGLPSSSSYALVGGLIGAIWVAAGGDAVHFATVVSMVLIPMVLALVAGVVALVGTYLAYRITARADRDAVGRGFKAGQVMGKRVTEIETPQVFAAETASTGVILVSAQLGFPLSTTMVVSGAIFGVGTGRRLASVRWGLAGQMLIAWLLTLPSAVIVGALAARVAQSGTAGTVIVGVVGAAVASGIYALSRRQPVGPNNVNDMPASRLQPAGAEV